MTLSTVLSPKAVKLVCLCANQSVLTTYHENLLYLAAGYSSDSKDDNNKELKLPVEPQNCCMSGCANCVWVTYAEELAKVMNDGGATARKKILDNVKDPNLRAFLMLELQHLFNKKQ